MRDLIEEDSNSDCVAQTPKSIATITTAPTAAIGWLNGWIAQVAGGTTVTFGEPPSNGERMEPP